jgi:glutamate carboxypeptidase
MRLMAFLRMTVIIILLIGIFPFSAFASLESPVDKIKTYLAKQQQAEITLLHQLVNINSGTTNVAGVKRTGELLRPVFKQLGFTTRWVEEPSDMHRAPTLIAERKGKQGKRLLLIGHLDTVYESKSVAAFTQKTNTAKGPGTADDKGGVVVIMYAMKALHSMHALDGTTITVVLTGDEEDSGKPTSISRQPLIEVAKRSDVALDFEPSITLETASIGRRGISSWVIESKGNESHSATIFQKDVGDGAIFELARILQAMRTTMAAEKNLTFNPGILLAGNKVNYQRKATKGDVFGKDNVVAKIGTVAGDLRFLSDKQRHQAEDKLSAIVKDPLPGTHSTIQFQDGIPAMTPTTANQALLDQYSAVSVDLSYGTIKSFDPGQRGAGDISHIAAIVPANLAGLGPIGYGTHSVSESVELASFPIQTARAALLIYRLTR